MGKNRKDIRAKQQASAASASKSTAIDIPEEEQWRIIEQTEILKQAGTSGSKVPEVGDDEEDYEISPLADEIFRALYLVIPMSFMLLLMEMYVSAPGRTYQNGSRSYVDWYTISTEGMQVSRRCETACSRACPVRTSPCITKSPSLTTHAWAVLFVFVFYSKLQRTDPLATSCLSCFTPASQPIQGRQAYASSAILALLHSRHATDLADESRQLACGYAPGK